MSLENYIMHRVRETGNQGGVVKFTLNVPKDLPQLEGHFPGNPITPTIVLIEISVLLIQKSFGLESREYKELKKSRVSKMILPEVQNFIEIKKNSEKEFHIIWTNTAGEVSAKFIIGF